jgi:opacity protein-like surface antigen
MRILAIFLLFLSPALALAQWSNSGSRAQTWEISIGAIYQDSLSVGGTATDSGASVPNSSSLSVKDDWGFTFNATYNFNDHMALGVDFDYLRPRYDVNLVPDDPNESSIRINHTASQFNGRIKGTYNLFKSSFTPFVDLGVGWSNFDSNVTSGPPITGCWWHPWWGYVCSNYYDTFSSTKFSYGAGIGARYELLGDGIIKVAYNYWELDSGGQSSDFTLEGLRIEFAWRF